MPRYRVKDNETGETIAFEWHGDEPPTEADMAEVFAEAKRVKTETAPAEHPHARVARLVKENLPAIGATVASLATGGASLPVAAGMAALGGAGGRLAQRVINQDTTSVPEMLTDAARSGATQGAIEGAGGLAGRALSAVGGRLAGRALGPIQSVAEKHPDMGAAYVREAALFPRVRQALGLPKKIGPIGSRQSAITARQLRTASRAEGDAMVAAADAAGPIIGTKQVAQAARPVMQELRQVAKTGAPDMRGDAVQQIGGFIQRNPAQLLPSEANQLVRVMDDLSEPVNKAMRQGAIVPAGERVAAKIHGALAAPMRQTLRQRVPGLEQVKTRTSELAGLTRALSKSATRPHAFERALGIGAGSTAGAIAGAATDDPRVGAGAGLSTGLLMMALLSPSNWGRAAIALDRTGRVSPTLLRALMSSHGSVPPETP